MLLVLMMLNWLLFPSLLQRQVTEVGYDEFISMVDKGQVETIAYDKQNHRRDRRHRPVRRHGQGTHLFKQAAASTAATMQR